MSYDLQKAVGRAHAELLRQRDDGNQLFVSGTCPTDADKEVCIDGDVDLFALVRAILEE